jgi:hypothetical protein
LLRKGANDFIEKLHVTEGLIVWHVLEGLDQGRVEVRQVDVVLDVVGSGRGSYSGCIYLENQFKCQINHKLKTKLTTLFSPKTE